MGLWGHSKGREWAWVVDQWVKYSYEHLSVNPWNPHKDTEVVMDTCGDGVIHREQRQEDL